MAKKTLTERRLQVATASKKADQIWLDAQQQLLGKLPSYQARYGALTGVIMPKVLPR